MLFTHATAPLFAKQAVVKQVLAVHTSAIEQIKYATDNGMQPLPSFVLPVWTDSSKMHMQVSCFHPLMLAFFCYIPDIQSMWGYIVFAFPFVHLYVHSFVRSFVRSSFRHRVKVFAALKFIRPHILKTL